MCARSTGLEVILWTLGDMTRVAAAPAGLGPPVRVGQAGGVEAEMVDALPGEGGAELGRSKDVHVYLPACVGERYRGGDSNPHALRRAILSRLRLPFRHPGAGILC